MINEIRTLLRNRVAAEAFGSEYVSPDYAPYSFSEPVEEIRRLLQLRATFDEATMSYVLARYLAVVHQPDIYSLLTVDPRITYDPFSSIWLERMMRDTSWLLSYTGGGSYSDFSPEAILTDPMDRLDDTILHTYRVSKADASHVTVTTPEGPRTQPVTFDAAGISNWIEMEEPYLKVRFKSVSSTIPDFYFVLTAIYRTILDPVAVLSSLQPKEITLQKWSQDLNLSGLWNFYKNGLTVPERLGAAVGLLAMRMRYEQGT